MVCENGLSTQVIIELAKKGEEVDIVLDWSKYLHKEFLILNIRFALENKSNFD